MQLEAYCLPFSRILGERGRVLTKITRIMKLATLFITVAVLQVSARSHAQSVTYAGESVSLQEVFAAIQSQTGYRFFYNEADLKNCEPVTVNLKDTPLRDAVEKVLDGQPLMHMVQGKTIFISKKPEAAVMLYVVDKVPVKGSIVDGEGRAVAGVSIRVKGQQRGTTSDAEGRFTLEVNEGDVLEISSIGYSPMVLRFQGNQFRTMAAAKPEKGEAVDKPSQLIGATPGALAIRLERTIAGLGEVLVNAGYYKVKDRLKTGSISKVTSQEITGQPITSPLMALQGRVPGVEITMPNNATPGVAVKVRIRGNGSLRIAGKGSTGDNNDGNYPLYVIDGVPINAIPINSWTDLSSGGYDPLSTLNPENIESIEVLKDADATAIYGSRGANGVILVTTKRTNKYQDRTNIEFNTYQGFGRISRKVDLLNTEQYLRMRREALYNDGIVASRYDHDLVRWDQNRYTDWQEEFLGGSSKISNYQVAVSSGTRNTNFRLGGGYQRETLIFPGNFSYGRISANAAINHLSSNQRFRASLSANYGTDYNKMFSDGGQLMMAALTLPPNAPALYKEDGTLNWERHVIDGSLRSTWENPMAYMLRKQRKVSNGLNTTANFSYEIIPGLEVGATAGYSFLVNRETMTGPVAAQNPDYVTPTTKGSSGFMSANRMSWSIEPQINYGKDFGEHRLDVTVGGTLNKATNADNNISASGYPSDILLFSLRGAGQVSVYWDDFSETKYMAVFGRIGYNYKQRYVLNFTGRRDGSSRFGPNRRYGNFGAVGAAWIFSDEPGVRDFMPFLSFAKIRGSYGITGRDAATDYRFYDLYDIHSSTFQGYRGFIPNGLFNPDFAWEATRKLEASLEASFVNNRIGFDLSWYRNRSSNQLVDYTLPATTGFGSILANFDATVQNMGLEGILRATLVDNKNFHLSINTNFSINRNKLLKFDGIEETPYNTQFKVGEPITIRWLYTCLGVDPETGEYIIVDKNKDGVINNLDKSFAQPLDRAYYGGFGLTMRYKELSINMLFQQSTQPRLRYMPIMPGTRMNQQVRVLDRWFMKGDQTDVQRFGTSATTAYSKAIWMQESDYNVEDAAFVRLKNVQISYAFKRRWLEQLGLHDASIYANGQNLFVLTEYKGLDPETSGVPPQRMISLGLKVTL